MNLNNTVVSFDDENLIVVDENDNIVGYKTKVACHKGKGILHRAFSVFLFNDRKELLLQKRSQEKQLWPLFWSNSCCSHPRKGENIDDAAHRRVKEELGLTTQLHYLYKFQYQASYKNLGSENELCSVYIGKADGQIIVNKNEIADWKFINQDAMYHDMQTNPGDYTPWFKMEWDRMRNDFMAQINRLF
jgi:isopentenyl-diphosphate delta-isomerase